MWGSFWEEAAGLGALRACPGLLEGWQMSPTPQDASAACTTGEPAGFVRRPEIPENALD